MKKTFPLESPKHQAARVIAAIKNDVRKYVKRERRKELPEGVDFWDFDCQVGFGDAPREEKHLEEVVPAIDEASTKQCGTIYIEIIAKPGIRKAKTTPENKTAPPSDSGNDE